MKVLRIVSILFISMMLYHSTKAQSDHNRWTIGVTYQPFFYWAYNKTESKELPDKYPVKPGSFNGQSLGIFLGKKLSTNLDVNTELVYSHQVQKYKISTHWTQLDSLHFSYQFNDDQINQYDIIKIPVTIGLQQELFYKSGFKIGVYLGPQVSYLHKYSLEYFQHPRVDIVDWSDGVPHVTGYYFDRDSVTNYIIKKKYNSYQEYLPTKGDTLVKTYFKDAKAFRDITVGLISGLELSKTFFDNLTVKLGSRFEYDLTRMEIRNAKQITIYSQIENNVKRKFTHQVRFGFTLSVGYSF